MPADFEKQSYWQKRFARETAFEWLVSSATFLSLLDPLLSQFAEPSEIRVLHLGGGTSDLHCHLRLRGFEDVTNVDYEPLAAERGRALEQRQFGDVRMSYLTGDATQLDLRDDSARFDLVIDKSAADAISCGGESMVVRMALGVKRYLAEGGVWVSLSYSGSRFDIVEFPLRVEELGRIPMPKRLESEPDLFYHCYLLRRKG
ncbi:uncharacterized protein E0L32_001707 [Thyridium curvatum]|uniref:Methyltransferase type 11 domain-containing protein n=1 Tax=Thyridium curvatum TaxID=1093900 RepID=A0A507AIH5_9PEZI|nr:uncharacterized protein E0L32_001492 [Thyridium curvatum]XP_030990958.1 uncharacterized protein E0L32_001707 [Thyridium curvatum]TPX09032.1 hypothetical protein E0L32_001492 [Thyridium curvatum]TPX09247.1 hypothetical protein E0L32_001707 [Thyridium curvatum]